MALVPSSLVSGISHGLGFQIQCLGFGLHLKQLWLQSCEGDAMLQLTRQALSTSRSVRSEKEAAHGVR